MFVLFILNYHHLSRNYPLYYCIIINPSPYQRLEAQYQVPSILWWATQCTWRVLLTVIQITLSQSNGSSSCQRNIQYAYNISKSLTKLYNTTFKYMILLMMIIETLRLNLDLITGWKLTSSPAKFSSF